MPPFINELAKGGIIGVVIAFFMWLVVFLLQRENKKEKDASTALIKELTQAVIQSTRDNATFNALHNERSMNFQKQVSEVHQAMMNEVSAIMQILCVQNKSIDKFDFIVDEMRGKINKICEKVEK